MRPYLILPGCLKDEAFSRSDFDSWTPAAESPWLVYFWLHGSLPAARGLSAGAVSGAALQLGCAASCLAKRPRLRRPQACGAGASLLRGMWNLPGPGIEPSSLQWRVGSRPLNHWGSPPGLEFPSSPLQLCFLTIPTTLLLTLIFSFPSLDPQVSRSGCLISLLLLVLTHGLTLICSEAQMD